MNHGDSLGKIKTRINRHFGRAHKPIKNKYIRRISYLPKIVFWFFKHPDYFFDSGLYYSNIEFCVTTNCTLRCKGCSHYISMFGSTPYTAADIYIEDLRGLLGIIRYVDEFRILGGEPFLYPELSKIVKYLLDSQKVGRVEIVTNGTIKPSKDIIALFPNEKLNIFVSYYGDLSKNIEAFTANPNINTTIPSENFAWFDHGELKYMGRDEKNLKKQYKKCIKDKSVFYNGKLFACACAAFGSELNAFELKLDEYVDFRSNESQKELENRVKQLKNRKYFTACNYCNWGTDDFTPIKVAEQLKE